MITRPGPTNPGTADSQLAKPVARPDRLSAETSAWRTTFGTGVHVGRESVSADAAEFTAVCSLRANSVPDLSVVLRQPRAAGRRRDVGAALPLAARRLPELSARAIAGAELNATLLRAQLPNAYPDFSSAGTNPSVPQLNATTFDNTNSSATYASTTGVPARQPARNAYFQYQTQSRLGNLATNRSNVYAIWITVGYFEAVPVLPSAANPEGYQIGAEKGSDTGAFERHRAFYMFDRSVPMGFQRGKDLNVDEGILVEAHDRVATSSSDIKDR